MRWPAALVVALVVMLAGASSLYAQEGSSAGLVIVTAEGAAQTYCVDVEAEATGWDLLVGAGLAVNSEPSGMGQSICSIDGVGCKSPQQSCFCQCQGSPCVYWSFWRQNDAGEWVYSNQGASGAKVRPGEVQGWVWGDGTTGKAPAPPSMGFGDICAVVSTSVVSTSVVSTSVVSTSVVSTSVVSTSVVSTSVVSTPVVGTSVVSAPVVGTSVVSTSVDGTSVDGAGAAIVEEQDSATPNQQETERRVPWSLLLVLLPLPIVLGLYLWRRR